MILSALKGTFNTYFRIGLKAASIFLYGLADRLDVKTASGSFGAIGANSTYFHNASDATNYLRLLSGVNTSPLTLTLPIADGLRNYALSTNASGTLSFQSPTFLRDVSVAYTLPDNHQITVGRFTVSTGGDLTLAGLMMVNDGSVVLDGTGVIHLTGSGSLEFTI